MKSVIRYMFLILFLMPLVLPVFSIAGPSPVQVIENLHATLLDVMKEAGTLGFLGRLKRLEPVIRGTFDFPFIARLVVGRYWGTFSEEEKKAFMETFTTLSIAIYAERFNGYSGEKFQTVSTRELKSGRILAETLLVKPDGGTVRLDYILHRGDTGWRIVNVIADGVSDLSLKRADYTSFLKNKGIVDLIKKLEEKTSLYRN
jgi:phospholipid transport system substrate-binding protein